MHQQQVINDLVTRIGELRPIPQAAQRALAIIRDPNSSMQELSDIVARDEAMASLVLRCANSAQLGLRYQVTTVKQACTVLGQQALHSLILASFYTSLLDRSTPGYAMERGELWRHSIGIAAGARHVAHRFGNQVAEEAYHAGLLCDVGKLAFDILMRGQDLTAPEWQGRPFDELEKEHFGIDHAMLGAEMARRWNLPPILVDAIANHHHPSDAKEGVNLAAAIHIADGAMLTLGIGLGGDGLKYQLDPFACQLIGWSEAQLKDIVRVVVPFIEEADRLIRQKKN